MESGEDEDGSDMDSLFNCEKDYIEPKTVCVEIHKDSEKRSAEKRKKTEQESTDDVDDENDDDFITVSRKNPKRLNRTESVQLQSKMRLDLDRENNKIKHEVCITSIESIPKQMALARLLKCENIKNIIRIKYKSFNKVLIQFQEKEDAISLLEN
ncbi:hypothetical protein PYW08_010827 [Mythimna loreyi]|uniref:Uncharacterized protein n=1 Tax=Mythimna loreyi TaxID=667449 RepID=A0ACC2Q6L9_9NEOP|nr:hypothetical protein PYW08_010827 [Mythimna loreyi]